LAEVLRGRAEDQDGEDVGFGQRRLGRQSQHGFPRVP
jgi:hypothetical protein